jgi:hypothetical protein
MRCGAGDASRRGGIIALPSTLARRQKFDGLRRNRAAGLRGNVDRDAVRFVDERCTVEQLQKLGFADDDLQRIASSGVGVPTARREVARRRRRLSAVISSAALTDLPRRGKRRQGKGLLRFRPCDARGKLKLSPASCIGAAPPRIARPGQ